ncbi:MAG: NAD(P)/FAD-dependent oxidoreductase [Devosia sp.]
MATVLTPDLCVIGAGATGVAAAEAARRLGAEVVVAEKGVPANASRRNAAIALRALGAAAERAVAATGGAQVGIFGSVPRVSFRRLHDHIGEVIAANAADSGPARLQALGVDLIRGTGSFTDPRTLSVGASAVRARRFVIATGARPVLPDLPGLLSVPYFTTETIFDNTRRLPHLLLVGAGPMGVEIALGYRRLGTRVTIVEPGRILPQCDPELADVALRRMREAGVTIYESSAVQALNSSGEGIAASLRVGDEALTIEATHILVASGRVASLDELNLEAAKIRRAMSDPGMLSLNSSLRTTNPRVFAVGEAAGHAPAAHLAAPEADLVVRAALLGQSSRYDPAAVPRLVLTDPPIAEIGLSEPVARQRFKTGFSVLRAAYAETDRARAAGEGMGLAKLIVGKDGKILGAGVVGPDAGELVALFGLAMHLGLDSKRLADLPAPYPSYAELIRSLGGQAAARDPAPDRWTQRLFALNRLLP